MPIVVLPPEVSAKIAAGEVVERPASVAKELVENALDAGARRISVEAEGGGVRLIRVSDDGCGIPAEEVLLAFQRHATSKLSRAEDLECIATLGFRGEALPSIAAVAQVTLVSRTQDAEAATSVSLRDGRLAEHGPRGAPIGTTVTVRELFATVPARRKFLKSIRTESAHIADVVTHYALAYPEVQLGLRMDGRSVFRSSGSGDLRQTMAEVHGLEVARALLEVNGGEGGLRVWGFVGPPTLTRGNRRHLSLFVNRRWVQSSALRFAVQEAYGDMLPKRKYPLGAIHIAIPPQEVDVNVHPTKREVRFRREGDVFAVVQRAVRRAIVAEGPVAALRVAPSAFGSGRRPVVAPSPPRRASEPSGVQREPSPDGPGPMVRSLPILRVVGQLQETYVVAEGPDGMYLIDQHTAHERLLFDQIEAQRQAGQPDVQGLLEPALVELSPRQQQQIAGQMEALRGLGFHLEHFGERAYMLRAVPAVVKDGDPAQALRGVLDIMEEGTAADFGNRLSASLACHSAVRAGQTLSLDEMRELVRTLEAAEMPRVCPHGRPIVLHLSSDQLERQFGRR